MTQSDPASIDPHFGEDIPADFAFQDEHPMVRLPFAAIIGERKLEGESLSLTQARVSGLLPPALEGQEELVTLRFDFDGFAVNLFAEAYVHKDGDADDPVVRLRFSDPMGDHLSALRYILNSAIAGDMVAVGQLLGFTGPSDVPAARTNSAPNFGARLKLFSRLGAIFLLSAGLVYFAVGTVYTRIAYQYEARPVTISGGGQTLRATSAGQISYLNPAAQKGDVIYAINANSGDVLATQMPCDCQIDLASDVFDGATVLAGDPLVALKDADAPLRAVATISDVGIARLIAGDHAELEFLSRHILPVELEFSAQSDGTTGQGHSTAEVIMPANSALRLQPGDVARLRFRNAWALPDIFATLRSLFSAKNAG